MPQPIASLLTAIIKAQSFDNHDRQRRAESLNILMLGAFVASALALLSTTAMTLLGDFPQEVTGPLILSLAGFLVLLVILYLTNKRQPEVASTIFAMLLFLVPIVGEVPEQIADGRGQLYLALPVIVAAVILPPWATFAFAMGAALIVNIVRMQIGVPFTPFTVFAYLIFALVSYLGALRLETALRELRQINEELDHRVEVRTQELRESNQQLAEANERLRELDQLKSRFLSMVSHELRTPLSAVQGFCEIMLAEIYGPLTDGQRNALDRITENSGRLLHLVSDLLDRARIEAGQLPLHIHPFSPASLIEDVKSTMDVLAASKGLVLTANVAQEIPRMLNGDEARLRQILVNLINNALKFTEKGEIRIDVYCPNGERPTGPTAAVWALAVSDTGPGIAEKDRQYIFDPFRRADDSSTRRQAGVGLGLSIVKNLVELMHGEITLESTVGQGTTFTVVLPLHPEQEGSV